MGREVNVADKQVCKEECVFELHSVPKLTEPYEMESRPFQHGKTRSCVRKKEKKEKKRGKWKLVIQGLRMVSVSRCPPWVK